jgi:phage host-nuclease inhibitor protein Gam
MKGMVAVCKAVDYANKLMELDREIENTLKTLHSEAEKIENQIMDVLHVIEGRRFSASQGFKLANILKHLRMKRREVKNEIKTMLDLANNYTRKHRSKLKETQASVMNTNTLLNQLRANVVYKPKHYKEATVNAVLEASM